MTSVCNTDLLSKLRNLCLSSPQEYLWRCLTVLQLAAQPLFAQLQDEPDHIAPGHRPGFVEPPVRDDQEPIARLLQTDASRGANPVTRDLLCRTRSEICPVLHRCVIAGLESTLACRCRSQPLQSVPDLLPASVLSTSFRNSVLRLPARDACDVQSFVKGPQVRMMGLESPGSIAAADCKRSLPWQLQKSSSMSLRFAKSNP